MLWLPMRIVASVFLALGGTPTLHPTLPTTLVLVAIAGALMLFDIRRRHDELLIGNLGSASALSFGWPSSRQSLAKLRFAS
ncbi:MAG TPA: hypothetical protein VGM82_10190 [Gemmatimonadaceae bacterium]